jgi:hypothetical protein
VNLQPNHRLVLGKNLRRKCSDSGHFVLILPVSSGEDCVIGLAQEYKVSHLQLGYQDSKSTFTIKAQLANGFSREHGRFVFNGIERSEYRDGKYLQCHLYVSTPIILESTIEEALVSSNQSLLRESATEISIAGGTLLIALPIENLLSGSPVSIEETIDLLRTGTVDKRSTAESLRQRLADINIRKASKIDARASIRSSISLWLKASISLKDDSKMYVGPKYENFENSHVISGGRPESNRQKF